MAAASDKPFSIFMLHKPKGVVVTRDDERGRKTVYSMLPPWADGEGWIPCGRLDLDSRGMLLFVRDGKLMDALTRPGACEKVYEVWVRGRVTEAHVAAMLAGVETAVGVLSAVGVEVAGGVGPKSRLMVTLDEGKNRHIRRMVAALVDEATGKQLKVLELKRTWIGPLELDIPSGEWRALTAAEESALRAAVR
jgi:23S rRNA pseudouridine2605 synthase